MQQQQVVDHLDRAADDRAASRRSEWPSIHPAAIGGSAAARLRGTLVTLAAAGRSSGVTTAITYEVRAGTSICDSAARHSRHATASAGVRHEGGQDQQPVGRAGG